MERKPIRHLNENTIDEINAKKINKACRDEMILFKGNVNKQKEQRAKGL